MPHQSEKVKAPKEASPIAAGTRKVPDLFESSSEMLQPFPPDQGRFRKPRNAEGSGISGTWKVLEIPHQSENGQAPKKRAQKLQERGRFLTSLSLALKCCNPSCLTKGRGEARTKNKVPYLIACCFCKMPKKWVGSVNSFTLELWGKRHAHRWLCLLFLKQAKKTVGLG